jgi:hypothetical protein
VRHMCPMLRLHQTMANCWSRRKLRKPGLALEGKAAVKVLSDVALRCFKRAWLKRDTGKHDRRAQDQWEQGTVV